MTGPDPIRDLIATMFHDLDVAKSRGGYTLVDLHSGTPLARLKPIPQSDRFELFYWSEMRGRWRTPRQLYGRALRWIYCTLSSVLILTLRSRAKLASARELLGERGIELLESQH